VSPQIRGWVRARPPRPPDPAPQRPRRLCAAGYPDKEAAAEAGFFHKEDERLLKSLLSKVRAQAGRHDPRNVRGARAAELSALNELVGSKLSQAEEDGERALELGHKRYRNCMPRPTDCARVCRLLNPDFAAAAPFAAALLGWKPKHFSAPRLGRGLTGPLPL